MPAIMLPKTQLKEKIIQFMACYTKDFKHKEIRINKEHMQIKIKKKNVESIKPNSRQSQQKNTGINQKV